MTLFHISEALNARKVCSCNNTIIYNYNTSGHFFLISLKFECPVVCAWNTASTCPFSGLLQVWHMIENDSTSVKLRFYMITKSQMDKTFHEICITWATQRILELG